jgi:Tfp pilus assembly protein PilZ
MAQRNERKHRRVRARSVMAHLHAGELEIVGEVENVSRGGVFVRNDQLLSVGAKVQLNLLRTGGQLVLSLPGWVANVLKPDRAASLGRKRGMGICFEPIGDAELEERLERFLRGMLGATQSRGDPPVAAPAAATSTAASPASAPPGDDGELQRLRSQVRGLLIDLSDAKRSVAERAALIEQLNRSVAERDALIAQLRMELDLLRSALEELRR